MSANLLSSAINTDNLFLNDVVGTDYIEILEQVKILAIEYVNQFAQTADFSTKMAIAFGDNINFSSLQEKWTQGEITFPIIEVRSHSELGNAWGAFAQSTGKIYLAEELLSYEPFDKVLEVLLEEYGHYIDSQINTTDIQGDEGAIFSKLVLEENIPEKELEFLQNKNDQVTIILDGVTIEIEQQGSESNPYNFQIIAKGSDIEKGVSINDRGKVAFVQDGDLFVSDGSNSPINFTDQSNGTIQPGIQINNQDQVIATTKFLFDTANVFLWDVSDSTKKNTGGLIARSGIPRDYGDPTEYFELLLSYPSVNNLPHAQNEYLSLSEKTVFSSLLKNDFGSLGSVLSTPVFVDNVGTAIYNTIPIDNPIYPVIADNGEIVVRLGNRDRTNDNGPMSPIVVYKPDLASNSRVSIAGVFNGFQALGQKPGISDDGQIVVFYGDLAAADLVDETPPMNEKEQLDLLNTAQGNLWYKNGGKLRLDELEPGAGIFASIAVKDAFWDKNNNQIFDTGDEDISRVLVKIADLYDGFNYFENNGAVRVNSTHRGEDFIDTNGNGIWNFGESYTDSNKNGVYDVSKQAVQIIYLGDNRNNDKGIYESSLHFVPQNVGRFDPDRPSGFLVSEPSYIIGKDTVIPQWGGVTTPTLGNTVKDVDIHDSINQQGDIAFWAENYLEEKAVIRASQQVVKFDQAVYKFKENDTQATITLTREGNLQEPLSLFVNFVDIFGINEGGEIIIDLLVNISSIFLSKLSIPLAIANKAISSASAEIEDFVDGFSAIPVFFPANESTAKVEIQIKDDDEYEGDQAVVLSLSHNNFTSNPLLVNNLGTDALLVIEDDESIIDALKDIVPSDKESLVDTLWGVILFSLNVTKEGLEQDNTKKILPLSWKNAFKQVSQLYVKELGKNVIESAVVSIVGSVIQHGIIFALEDYYKYQKKLESLSPTFLSPQSEASGVLSAFQSSSESLVETNNITPVSVNNLGYMIGLSSSDTDSSGILIKPDGQIVYLQDNNNQTIIPVDINNSQQLVGYSKTINDLPYAVMWQDNVVTNLVTQLGEVASQATAINELGQIIINSQNEQGALDAFLWLNGELIKLNQDNQNSYAIDINNSGQVIGYLETSNGGFGLEGFVWENGSMTKLGSLGGSLTIPTAINEQGKIIGIATTAEGEFQSFIWEDGQIQPLISLDSNGSILIDINDSGQVVGIYDQVSTVNSGEIESRAFLWDSGNITELGTLGGETTLPLSINNLGQIIGLSDLDDSISAPFIWQQGAFLNPQDFISMNENSELVNILDINDSGQVIAVFQDQDNNIDISLATIQNNQLAPQIYISNVFLREGNDDNTEFVFTVTLSQASDSVITVDYATADNTAIASSDYIAVNGTLTFNAGETEKTITVQVIGDTEIEPDESFFINLSNASGGAIADNQAMGTIINDDQDTSVIIVNSTGDQGDANPLDDTPDVDLTTPGLQTTLRAAIEFANQTSGLNRIFFDIPTTDPGYDPATGTFTIKPTSPLPEIKDAVIIDGTSQSGFTNQPIIELNGNDAGNNANGLVISAGDSTIKGLVINRFRDGSGIVLKGKGNNTIEGNFIGTDVTGTSVGDTSGGGGGLYDDPVSTSKFLGNGMNTYGGDYGGILIEIGSDNNIIGGTTAQARNIISGNSVGVIVNSKQNQITGNYIGTDVTGTLARGNPVVFIGDFFTWDAAGRGIGILLNGTGNVIGGDNQETRNIISGNGGNLLSLSGDGSSPSGSNILVTGNDNQILGNYIGTDLTGTVALSQVTESGISVQGNNNIIGGITTTSGNLISGNGTLEWNSGILVSSLAIGNQIQSNKIGTQANGTSPLGNSGYGVNISQSANNFIGGENIGQKNIIAFNGSDGIAITDSGYSEDNSISFNQIFSNGGHGISVNSNNTNILSNQIFDNTKKGVLITGAENIGNKIISNTKFKKSCYS